MSIGEGGDREPSQPESISAFTARVLNQLSLGAWLPGAFLVCGVALIAQFGSQGGLTLDGASEAIEDNWLTLVVLAVPALVVSTLLTQAFSFEAIRALEGYWRRPGPARWMRTTGTRIQLAWKRRLIRNLANAKVRAFDRARPALVKAGVDGLVILAVEADVKRDANLGEAGRPKGLRKKQRQAAEDLRWWNHCAPQDAALLLQLSRQIGDYPANSRIMPTKLGNIIRASEDGLLHADGDVEGFAMKNREYATPRVQLQHDQFRTRLDMYCTLVFVASALAVVAIFGLRSLEPWEITIVSGGFALLAWTSYGAAVASARGYCTALRIIDDAIERAKELEVSGGASAAS